MSLRAWSILRRSMLEYGKRFELRTEGLLSWLIFIVLLHCANMVLIVFKIVTIYQIADIVTSVMDIVILIIILGLILLAIAKLNKFY